MPVHLIPSPQSNDPVEIKEKKRRRRKKMWQLKPRKGIIRKDIYEYEDPATLTPRQQILWYQKHRHALEKGNDAEIDSCMNSNASGCGIIEKNKNSFNLNAEKKVLKRKKTTKIESRTSKQICKIVKSKLLETNRNSQIDVYKHIKRKQELQLIKKSLQENMKPVKQGIQTDVTKETQKMYINTWKDYVSNIKKDFELVEIDQNVTKVEILENNANIQKHTLYETYFATIELDTSRNGSPGQEKNVFNIQKHKNENLNKADIEIIASKSQTVENHMRIKKQNLDDEQDINAFMAKNNYDSGLFSLMQSSDCFNLSDLSFCDIKIIESKKNRSIMQSLHDTTSPFDIKMHEKNCTKEKDLIICTNNNEYKESCNIKKSNTIVCTIKKYLLLKRLEKQHTCVFRNIIHMEKTKLKNSKKVPLKITANMTNYLTKRLCCCNELLIGK
ncbi:hypothetical protein COBT_002266 [Conglomerata obtusa]